MERERCRGVPEREEKRNGSATTGSKAGYPGSATEAWASGRREEVKREVKRKVKGK